MMLDTCAIIWDALDPSELSSAAKVAIEQADNQQQLIVSDISFWEIAMLVRKGRLEVAVTAAELCDLFMQSRNVTVQPITPAIAQRSVLFGSEINNDPAARLIAATAIELGVPLLTADNNLRAASVVKTLW